MVSKRNSDNRKPKRFYVISACIHVHPKQARKNSKRVCLHTNFTWLQKRIFQTCELRVFFSCSEIGINTLQTRFDLRLHCFGWTRLLGYETLCIIGIGSILVGAWLSIDSTWVNAGVDIICGLSNYGVNQVRCCWMQKERG